MSRGTWVTELAQLHAPDVVTYAVPCRPNASNHNAGFSVEGFEHRQLLKAAGRYRAERMIIATTPVEILALAVSSRGRVRHIDRWHRGSSPVVVVPSRDRAEADRPAFLIGHARRFEAVEVVPLDRNDEAGLSRALGLRQPTVAGQSTS